MSWLWMALAIVAEVGGTTFMKLAQGFARPLPAAMVVVCYTLCFTFLTIAIKRIDLSLAYAVWAGVGTALVAVIGVVCFEEPMTPLKLTSLLLIVLGVAGLKLGSPA